MAYRHSFHAANSGDVLKHSVLAMTVSAISRKPTPFFYFDVHSGAARFSLTAEHAQKKREYLDGISRVWANLRSMPDELSPYINAIRGVNEAYRASPNPEELLNLPPDQAPPVEYYPGSPWIVNHLKRTEDRMILCERNVSDFLLVKKEFDPETKDRPFPASNITVHNDDGYRALLKYLPPKEKRGLVLLDPPYERQTEWTAVAGSFSQAHKLWQWGTFMMWYPVASRKEVDDFHTTLRNTGIKKILLAEITTQPDSEAKSTLYGSGVVIANPPYLLNKSLEKAVPWLWKVLSPEKKGSHKVVWLTPEV